MRKSATKNALTELTSNTSSVNPVIKSAKLATKTLANNALPVTHQVNFLTYLATFAQKLVTLAFLETNEQDSVNSANTHVSLVLVLLLLVFRATNFLSTNFC